MTGSPLVLRFLASVWGGGFGAACTAGAVSDAVRGYTIPVLSATVVFLLIAVGAFCALKHAK